jgi:nucleoside-diphosphate-sugar epimerase
MIHLASPSNVTKFSSKVEVMQPNTKFLHNLLRYVERHAVYFSSSEIYRVKEAFQEQKLTIESERELRNWYPIAKLSGEAICETWSSEDSGKLASVIRLFHTYGPNLDKNDGRSFADFLWQASVGKELILKSDGSHKRTFLYVGDAITALCTILNRNDGGYRVFDLGSQNEYTILQFAQTVSEISGVPLRFNIDDSFPHSKDLRLYPNLGEIQSLGWREKIDLFSGVKVTLKHMQSKLA